MFYQFNRLFQYTVLFGAYIVVKENEYSFYRISSESDVLVTKLNKKDKAYARIDKKSYEKLASVSHYTNYDDLDYWN